MGGGMARAAALGAVLGAGWGVLARGWMRLVSTHPEFSWAGSLVIVALAALFGLGVGVAAEARRHAGARRWLRLAVLPGLLLFAGPGLALLPAFAVAGPLVARRNRTARAVALAALIGPVLYVWWTSRVDETTLTVAPVRVQVALLLGMPVLTALLAVAGHLVWGPGAGTAQSPSPERARSSRRSDSSREVPAGPA